MRALPWEDRFKRPATFADDAGVFAVCGDPQTPDAGAVCAGDTTVSEIKT
jgi:hypothetical protein